MFTNRHLKTGVALLALALPASLAPIQAFAQDADTQLSTITVEGKGETATGPVDGYAATQSSTGSKADTPINEIPQAVSVIGTQELSDRGVVNKVDEALRYTAGVTTQPFGVDGDTDWIYIRGFDASQTGLFLDGLSLYGYSYGSFQTDPFTLERVEVLKGPASVLYGGSNPGGLVNMVSKRPLDEKHTYTEIGINSDGNAFVGLDAGDVNSDGTISYRFTGKVAGGDQAGDDAEDLRGVFMPQITFAPDDATKLNISATYSSLDQTRSSNGFFPYVGTVVDAPYGRIDPDANYGEPDIDDSEYRQKTIAYEFEHEFDNGLTFSQNARYGHLNKREVGPYTYGYYDPATDTGYLEEPTSADAYLQRIGFEGVTKVDTFVIDNRLNGKFDTGALKHDLTIGMDYKYYRLDNVQKWSSATPISVTDPVYGTAQPDNTTQIDEVLTQQQFGVYAQDQIHFGTGWVATLNGRYDFVNTEVDDRLGTDSYESDDGALSGRAGLAYEFANGLTPYASLATFFNPQIGTTSGDALKPEEGFQVEGGFKYEPSFLPGMITASVFHINKENWTVTDPLTYLSTQIGEVTSTGVELEGKFDIAADWKMITSFTYQDLEIQEHADTSLIGNTPYLIPAVQASAWLDYTIPSGVFEGVSIGAGLRYQGESWADMANTKKVPDATLVDAAIRYEKNGWGASLNVTNLFDKEYVTGCQGTLVCGYGQGQTFTLKLSKAW
ncbi:TonB-dependent siderophore receptor [Rhizobium sp. CG5]|uniref:TonB-dependent siderophore receptor n=1 Tax=Rhizobium sp. CG5 TaxID=2726076 RepID=UPI00203410F1|nr:TonB-dependent siderophore receptor [Rhizobium sp. CG5]